MLQIDKTTWSAVSAELDKLLEAEPDERATRLTELRTRDPALAEQVAALLSEQGAVENEQFLEGSVFDPSGFGSLAGQSIGGYTLERQLGFGGMGTVWLARRSDGRYEGQAAVKFLNLALLDRGGADRLRQEATVLAKLAHPNITHLIDAGVAAGGQPYLILEYIEGEPIDRWCDARKLDINARVRLFLEVLAAVSHAHGRLILHRDLKPSNILVKNDGHAKLLDFGIQPPATQLTAMGTSVMTPEYAAPEQLQGAEVTTATDVYALGLLLYVLLTGTHPTLVQGVSTVERLQALIEREPVRMSDAVMNVDASLIHARRASSGQQLARTLLGDLDNIVAKALKKAPDERYGNVDALADDLQRYLNHEAVSARADSRTYRLSKFVRRYRLAVGAASATILALTAGIVGTTWQAMEARSQRIEAVKQRDRAQALLSRNEGLIDFLDMMFMEELSVGEAPAIQRMLERSEKLVDTAFAGRPAQQADVMRSLVSYYTVLGLPQKQLELTERGMKFAEQAGDADTQTELACMHAEGMAYIGKYEEATKFLDSQSTKWESDPNVAAICLQSRAVIAQSVSNGPLALESAQQALQRLRTIEHPNSQLEASLLGDLAFAYYLSGKNKEANEHYQQAFQRLEALGRHESYSARRVLIDWAVVRYGMGDYKGGLDMLDRSVAIARRVQGEAAPVPPGILANRARGLEMLGRNQEALTAYREAYNAAVRTDHPAVKGYALVGQANVAAALNELATAQKSLDQAAADVRQLPEKHPAHIRYALVQARIDARAGRLEAAYKALSGLMNTLSADQPVAALSEVYRLRAEVEAQRSRLDAAVGDARHSLDVAMQLRGEEKYSLQVGHAALTLGRILKQHGDREGARTAFQQADLHFSNTLGEDFDGTQDARRELAAG